MAKLIYDIKPPIRKDQSTDFNKEAHKINEEALTINLRTYKVKHIPVNYDIYDIDHSKNQSPTKPQNQFN